MKKGERVVAGVGLVLLSDEGRMKVKKGNRWIKLTPSQFAVFQTLHSSPNKVFSRDQLLTAIGGLDYYPTTRTVDNHVMALRKKLGKRRIESIYGSGYAWK
jgi:DNA-binding response OmpR family regulator